MPWSLWVGPGSGSEEPNKYVLGVQDRIHLGQFFGQSVMSSSLDEPRSSAGQNAGVLSLAVFFFCVLQLRV